LRELFVTFFYVGNIPKAPGTFGSIAAMPFALAILLYLPASTLFLSGLFLLIIGAKIITQYEKDTGVHDDKRIVIDEVAGVFIAVAIAPGAMIPLEAYSHITAPEGLALFIPAFLSLAYFRLFDIWKPSIIGRIDREVDGGWGVMGDDIVAGFVAGVASSLTWVGLSKLIMS
jgi:phosphatidylglycerophosphatase A